MIKDIIQLNKRLQSLAIFRNILYNPTVERLSHMMTTIVTKKAGEDTSQRDIEAYSEFVSYLYMNGDNISDFIFNLVISDANLFIKKYSSGKEISDTIRQTVEAELDTIQELCNLKSSEIITLIDYDGFLPSWNVTEMDVKEEYFKRVDNIGKFGYGMFAKHSVFNIVDGMLTPVKHPDQIAIKDLVGYDKERAIIINNTKALIAGKPAANILLSGDAGTGKSSTVKAVVNELASEGLRIVEVRKEQLWHIPVIIDELNSNPLKFIIFIDDLSFSTDDNNYSALKAILEGSVSARSQNVVIYATSNRRHIIKENFSDRDGDDIHRNDTMQQMISLSERFGIKITFSKPSQDDYFEIVKELAKQNNIEMEEDELCIGAEQFSLKKGGRSARAAKQYIDSLICKF